MNVPVFLFASFHFILINVPTILSKRELPSFLKVCNRNDPDLDKCIKSSILGIQPHLGSGIPEIKIPPFDPLHVNEFLLVNGGTELKISDMDFEKFDQFELKDFHLNWKRCHATMEVFYSVIPIKGNITPKGNLVGISLDGTSGNFTAKMINVTMKPEMNCIILRRKGREYLRFRDINLGLKIGDAEAAFNIFGEQQENDNFNNLIKLNIPTLIEGFEPIMDKALGEVVLAEAKATFESFPLDVLLPE